MIAILFLQGPKVFSPNPTNKCAWANDVLLLRNRTSHWQPASMAILVRSDLAASILGYIVSFKLKILL